MASRWIPVLGWAAVIFAFSSIPSLSTHLGTWDLLLRKAAHLTEYAILAVLLRRASGSYGWAFGLAVAYAASDEWHQTFVRGRHGSPIDVGIDAVGISLGLMAWRRAADLR
jgi:VanZ family protein